MNEPYLRPPPSEGHPPIECPPGHEAEAAGIWDGRPMEVVYDPRRHDVAFLRGEVSPKIRTGLVDTGWQHRRSEGENQMWVRDRTTLAHRRLQRAHSAPAAPRIA